MSKLKGLLIFFVLFSMVGSFTLFAGGGGQSAPAPSAAKPFAGKTIRVLSMTAQISDAFEAYLKEFQDSTGITVNLELYGEAQLRDKLATEFVAGSSTVDAFSCSPLNQILLFSKNGWFEPLDEYVKDPKFEWNLFAGAPKDQYLMPDTGKIGTLPLYQSVQLFYYRKDIFEQKRLVPPENYDQLLELCKQINDPARNLYAIASRGEKVALTSQFSPFLYAFGASFIKDGRCGFDSPEALQAVKFYGELLGNYAPPGILTAGYSQMTQLFNSGQVAMAIDANALYATLTDKSESQFYDKVGVAATPGGPKGRQSYNQVVWGISMYSGSKNKDAAWEFLKFAAGPKVAVYITPKGMPSFRSSVWNDPEVKAQMPADMIAAYELYARIPTNNSFGLPRLTSVGEARDAMGEPVVYSIQTKGQGSELPARMKAAADKVDALLKDAGEYGPDYKY